MALLKRGSTGREVKALQKRLLEVGFNPGEQGGEYGGGTEAAVCAFQLSKGLLEGWDSGKTNASCTECSRNTNRTRPSAQYHRGYGGKGIPHASRCADR